MKPSSLRPMLATVGSQLPTAGDWVYEPKYDGIRVLAFVARGEVALISRNGLEKTPQFPEVVEALEALGAGRRRARFVLDGEIVAMRSNSPARFQALQSRMHVTDAGQIERLRRASPAALYAFDLLVDGSEVITSLPLRDRRRRLERLFEHTSTAGALRLGGASDNGSRLLATAHRKGWEGIMAKRADAAYEVGRRTKSWIKLKIERRQEFVIGGYTEPRKSREHFGAILLGYHDKKGRLIYAGHTGTGFTRQSLRDLHGQLERRERQRSPFVVPPRTNEPAHWVRPELVAEIKFNEWTIDGKLRQPVFIGLRDDKSAAEVVRES